MWQRNAARKVAAGKRNRMDVCGLVATQECLPWPGWAVVGWAWWDAGRIFCTAAFFREIGVENACQSRSEAPGYLSQLSESNVNRGAVCEWWAGVIVLF